jgi:hypothetical protein
MKQSLSGPIELGEKAKTADERMTMPSYRVTTSRNRIPVGGLTVWLNEILA